MIRAAVREGGCRLPLWKVKGLLRKVLVGRAPQAASNRLVEFLNRLLCLEKRRVKEICVVNVRGVHGGCNTSGSWHSVWLCRACRSLKRGLCYSWQVSICKRFFFSLKGLN